MRIEAFRLEKKEGYIERFDPITADTKAAAPVYWFPKTTPNHQPPITASPNVKGRPVPEIR